MPAQMISDGGRLVPLIGLSAISNRKCRFRDRNELTPWHDRAGTREKRNRVKAKMPTDVINSNSTGNFHVSPKIQQKELSALPKSAPSNFRVTKKKKRSQSRKKIAVQSSAHRPDQRDVRSQANHHKGLSPILRHPPGPSNNALPSTLGHAFHSSSPVGVPCILYPSSHLANSLLTNSFALATLEHGAYPPRLPHRQTNVMGLPSRTQKRPPIYDERGKVTDNTRHRGVPQEYGSGHSGVKLPTERPQHNNTLREFIRRTLSQGQTRADAQRPPSPSISTITPLVSSSPAQATDNPDRRDYRRIVPRTPPQVRTIQIVLEYARLDYQSWLRGASQPARLPRARSSESYQDQFDRLVGAFAEQWWHEHPEDEVPPQLRHLKKWTGGWEAWRLEDLSPSG